MSQTYSPGERSRLRRRSPRARYEVEFVHAVVDEARICHVGFAVDGQPVVLPTIHARIGERLYLHGAPASGMLRTLATGAPACVTVTLVDGLVLARSAFHHSMNYRSAVLFGTARLVTDEAEKRAALDALVERLVPGRRAELRPDHPGEVAGTSVVRFDIEEASGKARTGPPIDDEPDLDAGCWAGVIPLREAAGDPEPAPDLRSAAAPPRVP